MGRVYEVERVFAEQLDKALAGQPVQTAADTDEDLRTALEFSQKMAVCRADPRLQFRTVLKANLLVKLNEKEAHKKEVRPWFWKVIPREPIWQALTVLAIMIVVGGVVWGSLIYTGPREVVNAPTIPPPVITTTAPMTSAAATQTAAPAATTTAVTTAVPTFTAPFNKYLAAEGKTEKSVYQSGEAVRISVSWKNLTAQPLTINEFPPIASLMEAVDAKPVYTFAAGQTGRTLTPGETAVFTFIWDQRDAKGNPVGPGKYYLELEDMYYNGQAVRMSLSQPVTFEIH